MKSGAFLEFLQFFELSLYTAEDCLRSFRIKEGEGSENVIFKNELAFFQTLSRLFQFVENV